MKEVTIVSFYWIDSERHDGWTEDAGDIENYAYTIGILIKEHKRSIVIAHTLGDVENCGVINVPYVAIKNGKRGVKKTKRKIKRKIPRSNRACSLGGQVPVYA